MMVLRSLTRQVYHAQQSHDDARSRRDLLPGALTAELDKDVDAAAAHLRHMQGRLRYYCALLLRERTGKWSSAAAAKTTNAERAALIGELDKKFSNKAAAGNVAWALS